VLAGFQIEFRDSIFSTSQDNFCRVNPFDVSSNAYFHASVDCLDRTRTFGEVNDEELAVVDVLFLVDS